MSDREPSDGGNLTKTEADTARILVVDDEPSVLYVVERSLSSAGYEVHTASSYPEALQTLSQHACHLLITDVNLVGHSGIDLLNHCRKEHPDMEVILITGRPVLNDAVETIRRGAYDYLAKPIEPAKIRESAAFALDRQQVNMASLTQTRVLGEQLSLGLRIVRTLGSGNMGLVALAEKDGQYYALKMLQFWREDASNARNLARFAREAEILAKIDHPNVVKIYDYRLDSDAEMPFILMEYVDGEPLTYFLTAGEITLAQKFMVIRQIADALQAVHRQGVIHRDIKPSNVMVTSDLHVKLTDFGVARLTVSSLTNTGDLLGTPVYMAPETYRGEELDARADLFSLGVLSYELFAGSRPFMGRSLTEVVRAVCFEPTPDPAETVPGWPNMATPFLMKLLEKERDDRYGSATDVVAAVDEILAHVAGS